MYERKGNQQHRGCAMTCVPGLSGDACDVCPGPSVSWHPTAYTPRNSQTGMQASADAVLLTAELTY